MTSNLENLTKKDIEAMKWYYTIELKEKAFTDGRIGGTTAMARDFLENTDIKNKACLDIGTQEAIVPTILSRQGAKDVVAYDRLNLADRIGLVKEAYNVDFDYIYGLEYDELFNALKAKNKSLFDVVVFTGVLYHLIDPLSGLGRARSFVRENGICIVGTNALVSDEYILKFNANGRYYEGSNYFLTTLGCLDYFLRMLRLRPIDCMFKRPDNGDICRVVVVCRAENAPISFPEDKWIHKHYVENDFLSVDVDYARLASKAPSIDYKIVDPDNIIYHQNIESVNLYETVAKCKSHLNQRGILRLNDFA
jgi:2-polyprenyl-3-methyl-5-hydroxy-6-metoxy-1,4-benzoquinol methylase